jgi:hypothetical protein
MESHNIRSLTGWPFGNDRNGCERTSGDKSNKDCRGCRSRRDGEGLAAQLYIHFVCVCTAGVSIINRERQESHRRYTTGESGANACLIAIQRVVATRTSSTVIGVTDYGKAGSDGGACEGYPRKGQPSRL